MKTNNEKNKWRVIAPENKYGVLRIGANLKIGFYTKFIHKSEKKDYIGKIANF